MKQFFSRPPACAALFGLFALFAVAGCPGEAREGVADAAAATAVAVAEKKVEQPPPPPPRPTPPYIDPMAVSRDRYRVLQENDWMRLLEATFKPGERDKIHSHPGNYFYALTGATGREYGSDGAVREVSYAEGDSKYREPAAEFSFENTGTNEARFLIFEVEPKLPATEPLEDAAPDSLVASPDHYKLLAESGGTRLILISLKPGEKDKPHLIPLQVSYPLTPFYAQVDFGEKRQVKRAVGDVAPQDPIPSLTMKNLGKNEIRVLALQVKPR